MKDKIKGIEIEELDIEDYENNIEEYYAIRYVKELKEYMDQYYPKEAYIQNNEKTKNKTRSPAFKIR